ncbi:unnamed protein product [Plutella xylostella]|uniref:(diamondback moth) hypothetical protein n=1 Tax=Plutella xylostella TaxID=51655 RepID=A0A8S4GDC0_PLUXY|nr:unnamed protein product [Plutella xylostella]
MANVCPIYKSGDKNDVTNYRPISLLTSLSKILEKVVNNQLLKFLEKESLLHDHQFGFRRGRSTEDAVANLVDHVAKKLDSGERCVGVFLDLAKAFDTVSRPILLKKMASYGIQGLALDWFRSYLSDRKQRIGINNTFSELKTIGFGVPQGSVLGPTLFLLYINDLNQISLPNATTFSFADDTAVIFHGHSWEDVVALAELGMRRIATWLQCNLLTLNATKTKYLAFHITERTAPTKTINIKIHQCSRDRAGSPCNCPQLERVSYLKYLGVVLDDRLVWDKQIEAVRGRIRKLTFCFKQLKMIANKDLIRLTYTALVQSILTYCIVVWGGAGVSYMIAAERAQRFVLKITLEFSFKQSQGWWTAVGVEVKRGLESTGLNLQAPAPPQAPSAVLGRAYHCSLPLVYASEEASLTLPDVMIQPFMDSTEKFADAFDCIGFTSVPIWSGLMVTFLLILMLPISICMILDIKTMDRFENSRGKQLSITVSE